MHRTVVINVVGLTRALLGAHTPNLNKLADHSADIEPVIPALTSSAQATYLTGKPPKVHGIVGNGWYFREMNEVWLWRQSNRLIQSPKVWDLAKERDPEFTCSNTFWWHAMATTADITLTPRPLYLADGRKLPDCYTYPLELREELTQKLGQFPLFNFWGPATSIKSSQWIADAAKYVEEKHRPSLQLVYLPHLDYGLQKYGPEGDVGQDLEEIDAVVGDLLNYFQGQGCRVMVLSEYGIQKVTRAVHPNRLLREAGMLSLKVDLGREYLDFDTCRAFSVSDHQIAHIYIHNPDDIAAVRAVFDQVPGIAEVLDKTEQASLGLDHERSGELVLLAEPDSWFTYYYWQDKRRAPDYAHQVEIHKKPGYDPCELFLDPELTFPKLKVAQRLAQKKLGFRYVLDVIAVEPDLVKGSHGVSDGSPHSIPILMSTEPQLLPQAKGRVPATDVCDLMLKHLFE
ncbi:alkaline phosphatase family protein [Marinimicrobium sp. ABcell2]|uniref:alkaline phosphatase family protein n=1 Tax=Marinimicrobium sp. ABcell2 TaxID=3069751 RepID=UPI0027B58D04|nr:nucleotide pyrophosphatase/phosphodiesterase family protein [Marinimicrobium sp. ABcell2]MDQ2075263.1 alkaline phosphatase family protein [Marinimicrobium sp. ABcell2]